MSAERARTGEIEVDRSPARRATRRFDPCSLSVPSFSRRACPLLSSLLSRCQSRDPRHSQAVDEQRPRRTQYSHL